MTREPQLGDTIRSVQPRRDGEFIHVRCDTPGMVADALVLVATGRWVVVERLDKEAKE